MRAANVAEIGAFQVFPHNVLDAQYKIHLFTEFGFLSNIISERAGAAQVHSYGFAVQISLGFIVHAAEMQYYPLPFPITWQKQFPVIPHPFDKIVIAYSGQRALRAERHGYLLVEAFAQIKFPALVGA